MALRAIELELKALDLYAKCTGQIDAAPSVNVLLSSEYVIIKAAVINALHDDRRRSSKSERPSRSWKSRKRRKIRRFYIKMSSSLLRDLSADLASAVDPIRFAAAWDSASTDGSASCCSEIMTNASCCLQRGRSASRPRALY